MKFIARQVAQKRVRGVINALEQERAEDIKTLRLDPFSRLGTAPELIHAFGGKKGYLLALKKLELQIYC